MSMLSCTRPGDFDVVRLRSGTHMMWQLTAPVLQEVACVVGGVGLRRRHQAYLFCSCIRVASGSSVFSLCVLCRFLLCIDGVSFSSRTIPTFSRGKFQKQICRADQGDPAGAISRAFFRTNRGPSCSWEEIIDVLQIVRRNKCDFTPCDDCFGFF